MSMAAPLAISLGTQLMASRRANRAQTAANQTMGQLSPLAGDLSRTGTGLLAGAGGLQAEGRTARQQGTGFLGQAAGYYAPMLAGSRGAMAAALAPERGQITDIYRGASRGLDRAGVQGAGREVAEADLARQKAGQLAGLAPAARAGAASALTGIGGQQQQMGLGLAGLGTSMAGLGVQAKGAGADLMGRATGLQQGRATAEREAEANLGMSTGGLLFDALRAQSGKKASGAGGAGGAGGSLGFPGWSAPRLPGFAPSVAMYRP